MMIYFLSVIIFINLQVIQSINWNQCWAYACDFRENNLVSVPSSGQDCGGICDANPECTHFTWTNFNQGTCWLKKGSVSKDDAFDTGDRGMVCGIKNCKIDGNNFKTYYDVLATCHQATEVGACSLPEESYSVNYPVALGDISSLQDLRFDSNYCGHILTINCGNGEMDIIVTNSNLGGGLDLYGSTWNRATNNRPPGEAKCSVRLSSKNAFNFDGPKCYHATGEVDNEYYRNVGLLNTGSKIVTRAVLNGNEGAHRGANPYFAFDGRSSSNDQVTFYFKDGGSHSVRLADCLNGNNKQIWS